MVQTAILFRNARVLDGRRSGALDDHDVLVDDGVIREVTAERLSTSGATVLDLAGRTLMPGLIDLPMCTSSPASPTSLPMPSCRTRSHRSATVNAAKVLGREGKLGVVEPGAFADLIVVDGDPLADIALLAGQDRHMPVIMNDGVFVKNRLDGHP